MLLRGASVKTTPACGVEPLRAGPEACNLATTAGAAPVLSRPMSETGKRGGRSPPNFPVVDLDVQRGESDRAAAAASLQTGCIGWRIILALIVHGRSVMKSSARNQFRGVVTAVRNGAINDEVEIEFAPGQKLVSMVTHESRQALKLEVGAKAIVLIKASSILLVSGSSGMRFSARNQLTGEVDAVKEGAVNSEVLVRLPSSAMVVAVVTNGSVSSMGLRKGDEVTAMFKASSAFIAVDA
jgi:molybdopterin-binding protein